MSAKQDKTYTRTATDLERKYSFGKTFAEITRIAKNAQNTAYEAKKNVGELDQNLKQYVDGKIDGVNAEIDAAESEMKAYVDASDATNKAYVDSNFKPKYYAYPSVNGGNADDYKEETHLFVFNMANTPNIDNRHLYLDVRKARGELFSPSGGGPLLIQDATGCYSGAKACRTSLDNGATWGAWEYENPPMITGVEYRTTERWKGYTVFIKLVDLGTLPNTTSKLVSYTTETTKPIGAEVIATRTSDGFVKPIPFMSNGGNCEIVYSLSPSGKCVEVVARYDCTGYTGTAIVRYIKP